MKIWIQSKKDSKIFFWRRIRDFEDAKNLMHIYRKYGHKIGKPICKIKVKI